MLAPFDLVVGLKVLLGSALLSFPAVRFENSFISVGFLRASNDLALSH
jgi:hypothetical protein